MTEKLQEYLVKYRNLEALYSKGKIDISKNDIKKMREKILIYLDEELNFKTMYEILKSVEEEGLGFYVETLRKEQTSKTSPDKFIFQSVEVGVRYKYCIKYLTVIDKGYLEKTRKYIEVNQPVAIKPEEIVSISNLSILECIEKIDYDVYEHIVDKIIQKLYEKVD